MTPVFPESSVASRLEVVRKGTGTRPRFYHSSLLAWKRGGLPYPFSLSQVPALVLPHDFQARADREAQQRNEGIAKSNAIDVVGARPANQVACDIVAPEKQVENGKVDVLRRCNLSGRSSPLAPRRRLDIGADEPLPEPSWRDVLHRSGQSIVQRLRHRRQVDFIGNVEVLQALANAPHVFCWPPIELVESQPTGEISGPAVGVIQFVGHAYRPGRQSGVSSQSHGPSVRHP
jgi:hypothetical protein